LTYGAGTDILSYIKAAVDCEIKWIQSYSNSQSAQSQLGARSNRIQHKLLLKKWLSLAPAVLPDSEYCTPTLSHPDLHACNIFVNDDKSMSLAGIIDWQGATIRPLFEIEVPEFLKIDTDDLKYARLPAGKLHQPVLPDNFEQLEDSEKVQARAEVRRVASKHEFLEAIRQLLPAFHDTLCTPLVEPIRNAIYYSSYSWSDGLPLLEQCLVSISAMYGTYIRAHKNYPVCPVSISEEDLKRHKKEFDDIVCVEESLDVHIRTLLNHEGIIIHQDGSVDSRVFELAQSRVKELFVSFTRDNVNYPEKMKHWPMREGKFVHSMESCV
jgi:Phosphotransferase enzyme family